MVDDKLFAEIEGFSVTGDPLFQLPIASETSDETFVVKCPCYRSFQLRCRDINYLMFGPGSISNPGKHIRYWICH